MPMQYQVRPMRENDVPDILGVQAVAYPPHLLESAAFYLNRLRLAPDHCWVAEPRAGGGLLGYLVSYPWDAGLPPALDAALAALPEAADHWFLHDCAVAPAAQGLGVGAALVRAAGGSAAARGLRRASLVSLASALGYWRRRGYEPAPAAPGLREKLAGYGPGACYMRRALPL
ncbi:GNAT family N-acetyltransferase [Achromobacter sp. Marseille-Q4962]|uniref:GNAT family N-acetyltransferase n=1 Tax=Achromobacter sp. Marseille-Q4962 TaxID=2942202 RepID=UPI0020748901|nr:GNAT family N-acetyltransferase [Achromobacter sp. Marseille-Q4962]